jgi:hypothetical protein
MKNELTKLYCYVDESGQDVRSDFFVVVSIISEGDQNKLRERIIKLEQKSNFGRKKWHKSRSPEREEFLELLIDNNIASGDIYYSHYKKQLPFFLPLLETLTKAIAIAAPEHYRCIIYVDGIDFQKAVELTNALRLKNIKTAFVRSARDESEPLIRLADRWVGCIRASLENNPRSKELVTKAVNQKYLKLV